MNREEAIDIIQAVKFIDDFEDYSDRLEIALDMAIEALKERPHGEWIYHKEWALDGECAFECSKCGMGVDVDYNFCPNCGADMRKEVPKYEKPRKLKNFGIGEKVVQMANCEMCSHRGICPWAFDIEEECEDFRENEQTQGEWLVVPVPGDCSLHHVAKCSLCGLTVDPIAAAFMNYCFNCGANMRGEENDK